MLGKNMAFLAYIRNDLKGSYLLRDVLRLSGRAEEFRDVEEAYQEGGYRGGQQIFEYNFYKGIKLGYY